jgi:hypothetical protein
MSTFFPQEIDTGKLPDDVISKWSKSALCEGFVPFPKKLLRGVTKIFDQRDGVAKLAVILAVVDFKRAKLTRNPSADYLAFIAGMDVDDFRKHLKDLNTQSLVKVSEDQDGRLDVKIDGLLMRIDQAVEV